MLFITVIRSMGVCQRFKSNMIYFDIKAVHCNTIFYASVSNLKGTPLSCLDNVRSASRVSHHNTVWVSLRSRK